MSSPVSLFMTTARASLGNRRDMSGRADIDCWRTSQHDSISSFAALNVLLRVRMHGKTCGSFLKLCVLLLGACGEIGACSAPGVHVGALSCSVSGDQRS